MHCPRGGELKGRAAGRMAFTGEKELRAVLSQGEGGRWQERSNLNRFGGRKENEMV